MILVYWYTIRDTHQVHDKLQQYPRYYSYLYAAAPAHKTTSPAGQVNQPAHTNPLTHPSTHLPTHQSIHSRHVQQAVQQTYRASTIHSTAVLRCVYCCTRRTGIVLIVQHQRTKHFAYPPVTHPLTHPCTNPNTPCTASSTAVRTASSR